MNNYIFAYYQAIKNGDEVVGDYIRKWYEQIIQGLENRSFFYSAKKANKSIKFVENF